MTNIIQAKPTLHSGYMFRSKLEARWAVFFESLGIPYQYEPEALLCADGSQYTPDFFLPTSYSRGVKELYLEIKPLHWEYDINYTDRIGSAFPGSNLVLITGDPMDNTIGCKETNYELGVQSWDNYMEMIYCEDCNVLKVDYIEYECCPCCGNSIGSPAMNLELKNAAGVARLHRFKFNQ